MSGSRLRARFVGGCADALRLVLDKCAAGLGHETTDHGADHVELIVASRDADAEGLRVALSERDTRRRLLVVVVGTGSPLTLKDVCVLMRLGADEVIDEQGAGQATEQAAGRAALVVARWCEVERACAELAASDGLVGESPAWRGAVRDVIENARYGDGPLLIGGESGTGKQVLAELAHRELVRRGKAKGELVTLDCTTLQRELSGSELFGHVKGAFTGSMGDREGAIARAHGKVLFLDEIGDLSLDVQASLLRALQEGTYKPVGSDAWRSSSFRLVCATHRDLADEVAAGRFRLDLFYRICGATCRAPALRERREDILALFEHFYARATGTRGVRLAPALGQFLLRRAFPGNVRELQRLAEAAARNDVGGGEVTVGMLPRAERDGLMAMAEGPPMARAGESEEAMAMLVDSMLDRGLPLRAISREVEDVAITRALARHGQQRKAAHALGVTERALQLRRQRAHG